jgi:hypothetical protein
MHPRHNLIQWAAATAAVFLLASVGLRGQEPPSPQARAMALTWKLIADANDAREDAGALAIQALALPADQAGRLRALDRQQAEEKARMLRELRRTYAAKVRDALDDAQRPRYDAVLGALDELADAESTARDAFVKAAALTPEQAAGLPDSYVPTSDLTTFLGVDQPTRTRIVALQAEADAAQEKALLEGLDTSKWQDVESWRKHREQYAQAQQQAREQFEKQTAALLSPEQAARLKALEPAAEQYRQALSDARRRAYEKLYAGLLPAAPAPPAKPAPAAEPAAAPAPAAPSR